jgi:P27 family predicted phage terminase small subunit
MGRRGPPPDPMSGRTQRGLNSLGRGNVIRLPVRGLGRAKMPRDLHPEAKKLWRRLAPGLEKRGLLTALDQCAFAALCSTWGIIRDLTAIIERDGFTITGRRGKVSIHPAARERERWEKELLSWMKEFGLTPNSRIRFHLPPDPDPKDPTNEFFDF